MDEVRVGQALQGPSAGSVCLITDKTHWEEKFIDIYFNIQTVLIEKVVAMVSGRINKQTDRSLFNVPSMQGLFTFI